MGLSIDRNTTPSLVMQEQRAIHSSPGTTGLTKNRATPRVRKSKAAEGNRTLIQSLGSYCVATTPQPQKTTIDVFPECIRQIPALQTTSTDCRLYTPFWPEVATSGDTITVSIHQRIETFPTTQSRYIISGLPACGKTTFGNWLRDERDFTHVDIESLPNTKTIFEHWKSGRILQGVQLLPIEIANQERIVFTWGYPPGTAWRAVISFFHDTHGFVPWWFTGPRTAAGEEWIAREKTVRGLSEQAAIQYFQGFTAEANLIHSQNSQTIEFYRGNILKTLNEDRSRMDWETIASHVGVPPLNHSPDSTSATPI